MTRFTKLVTRIRQLPQDDKATSLLKAFAEQLEYVRKSLRRRNSIYGRKIKCGSDNTRWMKQRLDNKLMKYCEWLGHKELING